MNLGKSSSPRAVPSIVMAGIALLVALPQAWAVSPTFTVANNTFPTTAVGNSYSQNVTLTVNVAVPITSISIAPNFTDYTIGTITGCTIDPTGVTVVPVNSVCTIPVTFTPSRPGSAADPPPISRSAPLLVKDIESSKATGYSFALTGSATGPVFAFSPGYNTAVVGNSTLNVSTTPGCTQQTDANGDGCPATDALIYPTSMAVDPAGNLYISDGPLYVVHKVDAVTGIISIYAGQYKVQGPSGSGGPATSAKFYNPGVIAVDQAGNVYLDDYVSGLWKINPASGIATIISGNGAFAVGNTLASTSLPYMFALLVDPAGDIYFAVSSGAVYRVDAVTNKISIVAGNGTSTFPATGYPGVATSAKIGQPESLAMDSSGNLYIGDVQNALVFEVTPSGNISLVAGTQATAADYNTLCAYDSGNFGPATSAFIGFPAALALDPANNLYIGEPGSQGGTSCPVRRVDAATGIIHVVAGDVTSTYGFEDNAGAFDTYLSPNLVTVDGDGNIYVGQQNISSGVSKILSSQSALIFPQQSQFVTGLQLVEASNVGVSSSLDLTNYPFPIVPVPSTATPTPFSNLTLTGNDPQDCAVGMLPAGGVCGIQVAFNPTSNASVTANETVEDNSLSVGGTSNVINMTGSAYNGATISLAPNPITFSSQAVGTPTAAKSVNYSILLSPTVAFGTATISGTNASSFQISTGTSQCTSGLAVSSGGDCNIYVIFDPQAGGALSATLNVTFTSKGVTYTMTDSITGTGVAPPQAATPLISPAGGTYNAPVAVQITDASTTPTIYYTTTGTAPVVGTSPTYSSVFTVTQSGTEVQAVATAPGDVTSNQATPATYTIQPVLSFNAAAVGIAPGSAQTLTATVSLAGTTAPTAVLHYGHDYSAGAVSCTPNVGIEVCTVPITFIPTLPGGRKDALFLMNGATRVATVLLGGIGNAPLSLLQPGVVTNPILNGPNYLYESTVDENGTVYVVSENGNTVYSVTKAGVVSTLPIPATPGNNPTGLSGPKGISIDGAGVLYIAQNTYSHTLLTYDTVQGILGTLCVAPPSLGFSCSPGVNNEYLYDVSSDAFGNLFVLQILTPQDVIELTPAGSYSLSPAVGNPGPSLVAVDTTDHVFEAGGDMPGTGNPAIEEIVGGVQTSINSTGGVGGGMAIDAADTIYATRYSAGSYDTAMLAASNYQTPLAGIDGGTSGEIESPLGLSLGSDGTLFVGNYNNLDKVDRTQGAVNFGTVNPSITTAAQNVGIYNGGNQPLTLSSIALTGSSAYATQAPATGTTCTDGLVLQPGSLCLVGVTLTTPAHGGLFTGSVLFTTNSLNTASTVQTVSLTGQVNGVYVTASPNPLNFANQVTNTTSGAQTVTLTNNGATFNATIFNLSGGGSAYNVSLGTCASPTTLAPGQSCQLSVTFDPALAQAYDVTESFSVNSSGGGGQSPTPTFAINGTGIAPTPVASLSTTPIAFTNQIAGSTSAPLSATLSNTGNGPLTITGITLAGSNPTDFAVLTTGTNVCGATLAAGATCNIYVTFTPASAASFSATLQVADNGAGSPQTLGITGTGVAFVSNVGTAQGATAVTVQIGTAGTLNQILVRTLGAGGLDYLLTSGSTCTVGTAYTVGQTCTVNVNFAAEFAGIRNGAIVLTDASGNVLSTTYLPGLGNAPQIAFTPATQSNTLPASTYEPYGVALDSSGNIYFADEASNGVYKLPKVGSSYGTAVKLGTGFSEPVGVAVDGAGNVYVGNYAGNTLVKIPWNGSTYGTQATVPLGSGAQQPRHLTVDGYGNIYYINYAQGGIVEEVPWNGTSYGTAFTLPFTGLNSPNGVAVDQNGDVFCAETYGQNIVMLPKTSSGFGTQVTVASGLVGLPIGLALDPHGNVYVADQENNSLQGEAVLKVPFTAGSYGTPVNIPVNGLAGVWDIALDQAGNIYVADFTEQQIFKLDTVDGPSLSFASTNVGSTSTDSPKTVAVNNIGNATLTFAGGINSTYPNNFPENTLASNLCAPSGTVLSGASCNVSVNFTPTTSGPISLNVSLTDNNLNQSGANQLIPVGGTGLAPLLPIAGLSPNLTFTGQVVGTTSEAMVVTLSNTGNASLTGITPSITGTNPSDFAITTGTNACGATLAASATCNIYITFTPASATTFAATLSVADNAAGSPQTVALSGTGVAFSSNVGTAEASQPVTVNITTAGTLNSIQVLTQGITSLDFTQGAAGTCTTTTAYTVGQTCTVNVIFNPQAPGARPGAVILTNSSNVVLGTAYLPGKGIGPELVFSPGVQSTLPAPSTSYSEVYGNAVDAGLNVYVADGGHSRITKIPWTGTSYGTPITLPFTLLNGPSAVAVDGAGNVFITDDTNNRILELPWNGTSYGTQIVLDQSLLPAPAGIVVDGNGNLFFTDQIDQKLVEMPMTSSGYGAPTIITAATGLHSPHGIAVDANLNIYIADSDNQRVVEIPWNGTSFGTEIVVPTSNMSYPEAVAVDAAGDVYVANTDAGTVVEEPWNGTSFGTQVATGFHLGASAITTGISIDGNGNLYASDGGNNVVDKLTESTPPSLTFAATNIGSTSSDSPQTVTVTNIGNGTAGIDNVVSPTDFRQAFTGSSYCEGDGMLTLGESCTISINFKPTTSGPLSEDVVLTVNENGTNPAISIPVSGTGNSVLIAQTINFTQPTTPVTWSSSLTVPLVATGGASGNPVTFSIDGTSTGTGSITSSTLNVTTPGTFVIDANQAGNSTYSAAPQVQRTLVVNQAPQTINFTAPATPVIYSGSSFTVSLVATGGASGNTVTFTVDSSSTAGAGSITGSTLTVTGLGTIVIDANQAGNTDYLAATQVQQTVLVNAPTPQAINFTQPTTPVTYSSGLTIPLVATGGASGNPVLFSLNTGSTTGTGSISSSTLTVTGVGTFVINANQAGNATYSAAPQVSRTVVVTQAPQVITFTQPTTPVTYSSGLQITLSATGGASGNAVTFTVDGTSTATGTVSGSTVTVTSAGNLVIDANQAGNANYTAATQVQHSVTVNVPPPDFSFTATPPSNTVTGGTAATYTVTVTPLNGFSSTVTLSLAGQPTGATVTFAPTTLTPSEGAVNSTLTVTPTALVVQQSRPSFWPLTAPTLALLILLPFKRWRKVWKGKLLLLVAGLASLTALGALGGCGGGFGLLQSQNYTLTITGTSGSTTHTTTVQLTVKQ